MSLRDQQPGVASFTVENIGGITSTNVDVEPGVTVLVGENATNRTSFLQAIMAGMGSDQASLKADVDQGRVEMTLGGEDYERTLETAGEAVQYDGDGYLDDPTVAELFAFLHEANEARLAVSRGADLHELIMRPIDVEEIKEEIERLREEKGSINDKLATIESRKRDLPELEERRDTIEAEIESKREELAELEETIDESSNDIEESQRVKAEFEDALEELRSVRSELETVRRDIETQQESISSLRSERSERETELSELPAPESDDTELAEKIETLRNRRQSLNGEISDLQSLISYNQERLEEGDYELLGDVEDDTRAQNGNVTDQLLEDANEEVVCWTCGSRVQRDQIEETVTSLEDLREQKVQTLNDVNDELDEYETRRREIERTRQRRDEIERELEEIETEIERRQERISTLKDSREELTEEIERLETTVDEFEDADFEEILTLHREANQLEFDIDRLESTLEDVTDEIAEIESMIEEGEELRERRERLGEQLTDARTRIEQIEKEAVEAFNDHMDAILDILEYENLDRIWIDRTTESVRQGRETVDRTVFELHVVRTTDNDVAYDDTIDHLSESERKVTGLVFALAGYLVHDLHEDVPFMLLDSLEAIDAERIARLIDYFAEYAEYLVVALLPEDAQAVDDDYRRLTSI
ncbi:chromosome segregation protein SMC [Halorhabdus sp. CBA1104]|uniref:archaea-specific SMC-related protein n=1 Tax=Halorhabdus sp. CBA1104 TaxID=1380432 RepID=UPI0012B2CE12|nr:archaea-specific SMC-related protein [Halorhabdus sp. CBA1104]QGN06120.1 chromosome segregation protein SMC [Halorhabdus sp. CBA1104]